MRLTKAQLRMVCLIEHHGSVVCKPSPPRRTIDALKSKGVVRQGQRNEFYLTEFGLGFVAGLLHPRHPGAFA